MSLKKTSALVSVLFFSLFYLTCSINSQTPVMSDLVLLNGKIVTIDDSESIAEAIAVKFGKIIAVGTNDKINKLILSPLAEFISCSDM